MYSGEYKDHMAYESSTDPDDRVTSTLELYKKNETYISDSPPGIVLRPFYINGWTDS